MGWGSVWGDGVKGGTDRVRSRLRKGRGEGGSFVFFEVEARRKAGDRQGWER